jgi:hypothetical protein
MTPAPVPDASAGETAAADGWSGPRPSYRVEAQFGGHVTRAQLRDALRTTPGQLASHHPAVVVSDDGRAAVQLDVTAVDIWLALLEAMVSVKSVFHEPLAVRVVRSGGPGTAASRTPAATRRHPSRRRAPHPAM